MLALQSLKEPQGGLPLSRAAYLREVFVLVVDPRVVDVSDSLLAIAQKVSQI